MLQKYWHAVRQTSRTRCVLCVCLGVLVSGMIWYVAARTDTSLTHRYVVGQRHVFRLSYLSASASDLTGLTQDSEKQDPKGRKGAQAIYTSVDADLQATVVEAHAEGAWIAFALHQPVIRVVTNGDLALLQSEMIQDDLSRTLLALIDRQGRICSVHMDPRVTSLSHTFARALLATTQIVLPEDPSMNSWETHEHDPNGKYGVRYQRQEGSLLEPHIAVLTKERTQYTPHIGAHSIRILQVNSVAEPSGSLTIHFHEGQGHVQSVAGEESTNIHVNGKLVARVETTLRMNFLRTEKVEAVEEKSLQTRCASLKDEPALTLSAVAPSTTQETSIHLNELGESTPRSVLAELAELDAMQEDQAEDPRLYFKLKAVIYLHPEICPQLSRTLSRLKVDGRVMPLLTDALSSIGHSEAQAALQDALRARFEDLPALTMLVPALAMVENPTLMAEATLAELAAKNSHESIRAAAELGLGTMAFQLAGTAPERSRSIVRSMAARLKEASSAEARRHYLFVLGNAGNADHLDVIVPYLQDTAPEVRGAAAAALRWIKAASVDDLLTKVLAADSDSNVRIEAATALSFRTMTPATFDIHRTVFLKDESATVRMAVMQNLASAQKLFPAGRLLLTQAITDPCQAIRDEATSLLAHE